MKCAIAQYPRVSVSKRHTFDSKNINGPFKLEMSRVGKAGGPCRKLIFALFYHLQMLQLQLCYFLWNLLYVSEMFAKFHNVFCETLSHKALHEPVGG